MPAIEVNRGTANGAVWFPAGRQRIAASRRSRKPTLIAKITARIYPALAGTFELK